MMFLNIVIYLINIYISGDVFLILFKKGMEKLGVILNLLKVNDDLFWL